MLTAQREVGILPAPCWAGTFLRDFYIGLGLIGAASSVFALAQWGFGWYPFPVWGTARPPGFFFNPVHAAQTLAVIGVGLYVRRLYWLIPGLLPGLYLAHSRGGWAALALGVLATHFRQPLWFLVAALAAAVALTLHPSPSDFQRLEIWHAAWINLTFWGNGIGSFWDLYMGSPTQLIHPEYAHNDYLQTLFELGVWSVIPFGVVAWAASRTSARDWPVLISVMFMACFSFPIHMPVIALVAAAALISVGVLNV